MMITRRHDLPFFGDVMNTLFDDNVFEPIKKMAVKRAAPLVTEDEEDDEGDDATAAAEEAEDYAQASQAMI